MVTHFRDETGLVLMQAFYKISASLADRNSAYNVTHFARKKWLTKSCNLCWKGIVFFFCIVLFIFILHSRESELHRYILDGKSALAWELPFPRYLGHLSST